MTAKRFLLAQVTVLLVTTGAARAAQPMSATLRLLPDTTLPGLPTAFLVTVSNPADVPQTIENSMQLAVVSANGRFSAHGMANRTNIGIPSEIMDKCNSVTCATIPPHGSREFYIGYGNSLAGNEFFADERLNVPGTYTLTMTLLGGIFGSKAVIVTNSATLTVRQPSGNDQDVAQFLSSNAMAYPRVWTTTDWILQEKIAYEIRARFPDSTYAIWAAGTAQTNPAQATQALEAALAKNPTPSLRDDFLSALGGWLEAWSRHVLWTEGDADKAAALDQRAIAVYKTLRDVAAPEIYRRFASEKLAKLESFTPQTYRNSV